MQIQKLSDLFIALKQRKKQRLVVVNAVDEHSLLAVAEAVNLNIVEAIVTGNQQEILKMCSDKQINTDGFRIIHTEGEQEAAQKAAELVNNGKADIIMKGLISTDKYMKTLLNKENNLLSPGALLSHVTVLENPAYHKLLVVGDVAVIPSPDLKQKELILHFLIDVARALEIEAPKVAVIAATEQVLPGMKACTDAVALVKKYEQGDFGNAIVAGPMALDLAVDHESAIIKNISSPVAGNADCLLFPNIESGNVFYKMNTKLCHSRVAAIVSGAKIPVVLSSRGDSMETKLNSIALAAMLCKEY